MEQPNCASCDHKKNPDGGYCYMFQEPPDFLCEINTNNPKLVFNEEDLKAGVMFTLLEASFDDIFKRGNT